MRDLVGAVMLLGVLQGALLAPLLWVRHANRLGNRILALLVAGVALMLLLDYFELRFGFEGHPHLLGLGATLPFLFGPLLYLYAIALTRPLVRFDWRWLAHGLLFVAFAIYMAAVFYSKSGEEKVALARHGDNGPFLLDAFNALEVAQAFVYLALTWHALDRYSRKMQGYFSDLARVDLRWLKALVATHAAVWGVVLLTLVARWTTAIAGARDLGNLVHLGSTFVIFLTGYVGVWQPELVQKASAATVAEEETPLQAEAPKPEAAPPPKYQRNRLDDAEARELAGKLEALMLEKRLYREAGLTLPTLADALGVTPHMLSQVLNVHIGKRFFVFVNAYRAEALKQALTDPTTAERGVLELGFEVGFSSKSTLNDSFKKHTGMTPTEFRSRAGPTKNPN